MPTSRMAMCPKSKQWVNTIKERREVGIRRQVAGSVTPLGPPGNVGVG